MPIKKTKKRFSSSYGGGLITHTQRIVEIICENVAERKKIKLQDKFWNDSKWKDFYLKQIKLANKLLKKYDAEHIIYVLSRYKNINSILDKDFHDALKKSIKINQIVQEKFGEREPIKKSTLFDKL